MSKEYIDEEAVKRIEKIAQQEAIKNVKPSEVMKCFENIQYRIASNISTIEYTTIKQLLIKSQEQEKVLEILKPLCEVVETVINGKKRRYLKICGIFAYRIETDEEYELLRSVMSNDTRRTSSN